MERNYLPVTVVVIVLGAGLSLIPKKVELSQPYELVTVYNQTETTRAPFEGVAQEFTFRTGRVETADGFSPTLRHSRQPRPPRQPDRTRERVAEHRDL